MLIKKSVLAVSLSFLIAGSAFAVEDAQANGNDARSDVALAVAAANAAGVLPAEVTPQPRVTPRRFTPRPPSRPGHGGGAGGGGGTVSPN